MDTAQIKGTPFNVIALEMNKKFGNHNWPMMITERKSFINTTQYVLEQEHSEYARVPFSLKLIMECARRNSESPETSAYHILWLGSGGAKLASVWREPEQIKDLKPEPAGYHLINLRPEFPDVYNTLAKPISIGIMAQAVLFLEISGFKFFIDRNNPFNTPAKFENRYLHLEDGKFSLELIPEELRVKNYWEILED